MYDKDGDFFDKFRTEKNEVRGNKSEMVVTVKKGEFLLNHAKKTSNKSSYSRLKYKLFDEHGKLKHKHKTDYIYISREGKARWVEL